MKLYRLFATSLQSPKCEVIKYQDEQNNQQILFPSILKEQISVLV